MPSGTRRPAFLVFVFAAAIVLAVSVWYFRRPPAEAAREFSGSASCATCHPNQYAQWLESHHRHAMERPTADAVLGNFNGEEFLYSGKTTRFSKEGDSFQVTTENRDGKSETFSVAYTLGYKPLQQYLVDVGDGRIQALPFAWDSRDRNQGGQRWFHLYPKEDVTPENPLHWTRPLQNWNHMCGDCHTTGFRKNFSDATGKFESQWSEISNGCESCHGPGSAHIKTRRSSKPPSSPDPSIHVPHNQQEQIDQCGACHARRVRINETSTQNPGLEKMLETWKPQLPQDGLYFVDGQIRDEVFEIGSFLQSKMATSGVACTDCHDPHTARLKEEGNALCTQCHATFASTEHHFHREGSPGAQCVECHMPSRTYMVVDPRRDHRFSIPRPDLSDALGTPNPCVSCHKGQTNAWAAEAVRKHVVSKKGKYEPPTTLGIAAWQALHEQTSASESFRQLFSRSNATSIVKAAALASLKTVSPELLPVVRAQLHSNDPLLRLAAVHATGDLPLPTRTQLLIDLARDPSRAVRLEVASRLAGADRSIRNDTWRQSLDQAVEEYRQELLKDADRAEALTTLAGLQVASGDIVSARASFEKALQRDGTSLVTLLNYADFHRAQGNDTAAEPLLVKASLLYPDAASVHLALGLLRVRQKRTAEAVTELARAAELAPNESNTLYTYAVALYSTGQVVPALTVLDKARARFPTNPQIQEALRAYCSDQRSKGAPKARIELLCSSAPH